MFRVNNFPEYWSFHTIKLVTFKMSEVAKTLCKILISHKRYIFLSTLLKLYIHESHYNLPFVFNFTYRDKNLAENMINLARI